MIDDLTTEPSRRGTEVDEVVGGGDGVLVVFDDDERVAVVAQLDEGFQQGRVVARMEADGGFVEHVEHAAEVGAELRGEADALRLAAGKRVAGAVELEVAEADFLEELKPLFDLRQDVAGDELAGGIR